jgi:hypothetical protein
MNLAALLALAAALAACNPQHPYRQDDPKHANPRGTPAERTGGAKSPDR